MPRKAPAKISRRCFLATAAALAARPAVAATPQPAPAATDVIIVGAGAAGIAAARRIAAAGRRYVLVEASDHIGGRCVTDTKTFGVPFDRGAHWIYAPDLNPLTKLTPRRGIEVYPAPPSQKIRIGRRYAREGELEDFLAAEVRATRAINDAARKADVPCEQVMPNDLGDWRGAIEFMLGPFGCGKELGAVLGAGFFARRRAHHGDLLPPGIRRAARGACRRRHGAIVDAGEIDRHAAQPRCRNREGHADRARRHRHRLDQHHRREAAFNSCPNCRTGTSTPSAGSRSAATITSRWSLSAIRSASTATIWCSRNPTDTHTAAMLANVSGTPLCLVDVAGSFGRDLSARGEAAMVDFATQWLAGLYGAEIKKAIGRTQATRWNADAFTLGAASAAVPGAQLARRIMMEPVNDAIWFAGEAAHETLWGTVGGAWESGERAADAVLRRMGVLKTPAPEAEAAPKPKVKGTRPAPREQSSFGATPSIMRPER